LHSQTLLSNRLCRNVLICCGNQNWFKCNVNIPQFMPNVSLTSDSCTNTHGNCTVNIWPAQSQLCATVLTLCIAQHYHIRCHMWHTTHSLWTPDLTTTLPIFRFASSPDSRSFPFPLCLLLPLTPFKRQLPFRCSLVSPLVFSETDKAVRNAQTLTLTHKHRVTRQKKEMFCCASKHLDAAFR
jgi:hypothetical protein